MKRFDIDQLLGRLPVARALRLYASVLQMPALATARSVVGRPAIGFALLSVLTVAVMVGQPHAPIATASASITLRSMEEPQKIQAASAEQKKTTKPEPDGAAIFAKEATMSNYDLLHRWDPLMDAAAKRFNIPVDWIRAVMIQESGGRTMLSENRKWISNKGAMGLMQLMPQTWAELRDQYHFGADPFNPEDNINAGAAYLVWLHGKYGMTGMFAAYNAGPARIEQSMAQHVPLPAETQSYVAGVARSLGVDFADVAPLKLGFEQKNIEVAALADIPIPVKVELKAEEIAKPDIEAVNVWSNDDRRDLYAPCAYASGMGCSR